MQKQLSRGFTLVEILVSMLIVGVIGGAFTKLLITQNRYYDSETNRRNARSIARSATNILMADLRMVQDDGVDLVAPDGKSIRILVPYQFGVVCGTNGNKTTVSMLPIDSGTVAVSVYRGFAWRNATTTPPTYTYEWPAVPIATSDIPSDASDPAVCTGSGAGQAQIQTVSSAGRDGQVLDVKMSPPSIAPVGAPVFFWQRITYSFRASGIPAYANRLGLWRNVEGGNDEEIMAPFDTASRFRFYVAGSDVSTIAPPALITDIRGLELVLAARSPRATSKDSTGAFSTVTTAVFFKNNRAF